MSAQRYVFLLFFFLFCFIRFTFSKGKLGETCSTDFQCTIAFSFCGDQKHCACSEGFKNETSKCLPKAYHCPFGKPALRKNSTDVVFCKIQANQTTSNNDSCSKGYYCLDHEFEFENVKFETKVGHCCPAKRKDTEPTGLCPVGPNIKAACGFASHEAVCGDQNTGQCVQLPVPVNSKDKICCTQPCPFSYFRDKEERSQRVVDGLCYD